MIHYPHQELRLSNSRFSSILKRKISSRHDRIFHSSTTMTQNESILQRLYSFVFSVLDDHPYPSTRKEFHRRTYEIQRNIRNLNLSSTQQKFLHRLMIETGVTLVDLWQGSHIITLDHGHLYNIWSTLLSAHPRFSSHYHDVPLQQYGINFRDHQLLFGKTSIHGSTWFQMEAHGFDPNEIYDDPDLVIYHGKDFLKYHLHQMNVGPFGFSPHTEMKNPIIRPYQPLNIKRKRKQKYSIPFYQ
ncbi:unnamed protein product [Rotaria sordida]|uniref:Uncharacterized protein n=1 Tax=Rotaria sordida TaxID=392033 RepID=A0A819PEQ1_9BILA|nr:unnamed protein product [Rotaria sordida]CAF4006861.1 unnamed protein product [Rotaria sordida]